MALDHASTHPPRTGVRLPLWLGAIAIAALAVFLLWGEHRAHMLGALPLALLLLCPAMHLFMHGGGHAHAAGEPTTPSRSEDHT